MPQQIKHLNLPEIAGRVSDIRSAGQRRKLVGMQIEDIEAERATKKTRKNVMAEFYNPPGTKSVEPGQDIAGNAMGGYDWRGASARLAKEGDIKGALETAKAGREAKKSAADLKIKLLSVDKAERAQVMENLNLVGRLSQEGISKYELARKSGRGHDQAIQDMDEWYDSAGEQLIKLGVSASDIPQKFDPVKARSAMALVSEAGALDIEKKKVDIAKTRAEIAKIKRETGKKKLTAAQKSNNIEIDNSRRLLRERGVTKESIKLLTSKSTETGRENPDYDPDIARIVSKALQRKTGDDPEFEIVSNIYQLGKPGEPEPGLERAEKQLKSRKIAKRGTYQGRKVVQYEDGTIEYAD